MEVFTYGNGDFLFQIFSAVTGLMGDGSFATLVRIAILFGFLIVIYQVAFSMDTRLVATTLFKHYMIVIVLFFTLFVPKTDVVIRDEIKNTQVVVNQVPYGVGLFAHFFTTAEKGFTKLMEQYFSTPNDMKYNKTGYAYSAMLIDTVRAASPVDPYFKRTLNDFVVNCFFHDVLWGDKDLNAVITSNDLLSEMSPQHSSGLATNIYESGTPSGRSGQCTEAYGRVTAEIGTQSQKSLEAINKTMQMDIASSAPVVFSTLLNVSSSTTGILGQSIAANALKDGFAETAMYTGISAGAVAYASGLAEQQQRSSWATAGELSKKYIPILRQILEAFVYGLFPVLFIMMMTPMAGKVLHVYFTMLLWLFMWSPLYAILNLILNTRLNGVLSSVYGYYSLGSMPYIYQTANDITAVAGYMAWLVPTIAFAIAKGSDYALVSMASGIQGSVSGAASSSAHNISSPDGGQKVAAQAAHMMAAATHGADNWADGQAAQSYYQVANGMALAGAGAGAMRNMAGAETAVRQGKAEGQQDATAASGVQTKDRTRKTEGVQQQKGYADASQMEAVAARHGYKNAGEMQSALSDVGYNKNMGDAQATNKFVDSYSKQTGRSREEGFNALADIGMSQNNAIRESFGGDTGAYANFLKNNTDLSQGQQEGLIKAATAAGVDLKDWGRAQSTMENMKKSGALQAYQEGRLTDSDLRRMGDTGIMTQDGQAKGAEKLSNMFYGDDKHVGQYAQQLSTWKGQQEYTKFDELQKFADSKGIPLQSLMREGSRSMGVNGVTVSAAEAKQLGLSRGAGKYNLSWDDKGGYVFTNQHAGEQYQIGSFGDTGSKAVQHQEKYSVSDTRDKVSTGREEKHGDSISGTDGIATYRDERALQNALGADLISAKRLVTGTPEHQNAQRVTEGKALVNDLAPILERKGIKFDAVEGKGSFGLNAFGLGASYGFNTGSRDQTSLDILYGAYQRVVENATNTAQARGLSPEKAIATDRQAFVKAVLNEGTNTKPMLDVDRHNRIPEKNSEDSVPDFAGP